MWEKGLRISSTLYILTINKMRVATLRFQGVLVYTLDWILMSEKFSNNNLDTNILLFFFMSMRLKGRF